MSTDAGLMQPRNMTLIQGGFERGELERKFREWDQLKSDLTSNALQVLRASNAAELDAAKAAFEDSLAAFCKTTIPMNKEFLGNVLGLLEDIVRRGDYSGREPVPARPALRQAKPTPPPAKPKAGGKSRTAAMRARRR
jgi:hypothetical protein